MSRALLILANDSVRARAIDWIKRSPEKTRVVFQGPKRSLPQNDRLWAMLTEVSQQLDWHGQKYCADDWKDYFIHAYKGQRWMPSEDGGMVPIGRSTSKLDTDEFGELMDLIEAFCARHSVTFPWTAAA